MKHRLNIPKERSAFSDEDHYLATADHFLTGEKFDLFKHTALDMLVTIPQPEANALSKYYESSAYISHSDEGKGITAFLYRLVRKYSLRKKERMIRRHLGRTGTVADIGAGTGAFLETAKKKGWEIQGVEPNKDARERAAERGIKLNSEISDLNGQQFDAVTLWHVLEHLPNLEKTTEEIIQLVKPGGVLIIAVPNFKSFDAHYYKNYWAAYDVPRHLWHFSKTAVIRLFEGMNLIEIKPMWFDSFYVSLLSEKFKNGKSTLLKALWIGFRSNIHGISSGEYSSLQYCFKRGNEPK